MRDDVKACVDARLNFFGTYMQVPPALAEAQNTFCRDVLALAEASLDAGYFEQQFQTSGLSQRFNDLVSRCVPVAIAPTQEQKQASRQMAWEMHKDTFARDVAAEFVDDARMKLESDAIAANRQRMIQQGTYDDYTRASNTVDNAQRLGCFLGRLFGKKEK